MPMSGKPSNDGALSIRIGAGGINDSWIDEAAREVVVIGWWGETRATPSELSFERAMRDGGLRIIHADGSVTPARRIPRADGRSPGGSSRR